MLSSNKRKCERCGGFETDFFCPHCHKKVSDDTWIIERPKLLKVRYNSKNRQCERSGEIELVPGTLIEVDHGPGCHQGWTQLLSKNPHRKFSFYQDLWPQELRKEDRSFDEYQAANWLAIFYRLDWQYPDDPSVTPFIKVNKRNLEIKYRLDEQADTQELRRERKRDRFRCEYPGRENYECDICRESDFDVLTDKALDKALAAKVPDIIWRIMGLKKGETILCLECWAKLPFAQIYWAEKFAATPKKGEPCHERD